MLRALDPQRKSESKVYSPGATQDYVNTISTWWTEIANGMASHKLVDETASRTREAFVDNGTDMAGVNVDPATGNILGVGVEYHRQRGDDQLIWQLHHSPRA